MRRPLTILLLLCIAAASGVAHARDVRRLGFKERGKHLVVTGSFTDVFDRDMLERLSSGFATMIVVRFFIFRRGAGVPVALSATTRRVIYDLWEENYLVQWTDLDGSHKRRVTSRADALKISTELRATPLALLSTIGIGSIHRLSVVVEVNPVSPELLAQVRRWLARPRGRRATGPGSFFGTFVSVFVNPRLAKAERVLQFESQPFYRVKR